MTPILRTGLQCSLSGGFLQSIALSSAIFFNLCSSKLIWNILPLFYRTYSSCHLWLLTYKNQRRFPFIIQKWTHFGKNRSLVLWKMLRIWHISQIWRIRLCDLERMFLVKACLLNVLIGLIIWNLVVEFRSIIRIVLSWKRYRWWCR